MKIRIFADDRNLVGWQCGIVTITLPEAEKQLNNKSLYKNMILKKQKKDLIEKDLLEKILQDLAETSNNIFISLRGTSKMTEKQLKCFAIAHKNAANLGKKYHLKFKKDFLMFLTNQLYRTVAHLQKRCRHFQIVILKTYERKLVLYKRFE